MFLISMAAWSPILHSCVHTEPKMVDGQMFTIKAVPVQCAHTEPSASQEIYGMALARPTTMATLLAAILLAFVRR